MCEAELKLQTNGDVSGPKLKCLFIRLDHDWKGSDCPCAQMIIKMDVNLAVLFTYDLCESGHIFGMEVRVCGDWNTEFEGNH